MEPIRWNYAYNKKQTITKNLSRLITTASLSAMEFFTNDPISDPPTERYQVTGVSIVGNSGYINLHLSESVRSFCSHIENTLNGEYSYDEIIDELNEADIMIKEFLHTTMEFVYYMPNIPELFVLLSSADFEQREISMSSLIIPITVVNEIEMHAAIRRKYFDLLRSKIITVKERFNHQYHCKERSFIKYDVDLAIKLTELWIALHNLGYFNFIDRAEKGYLLPKIREIYYSVFGLKNVPYNKLRNKISKRKNKDPQLLPELPEAFKKAITKKS
jgi:hypothetical protein